MKHLILAAVAAITTLAATETFAAEKTATVLEASADQNKDRAKERIKESDTNNDGFISKDEWRARGDKAFSEIDANGDGKLTSEEFKAHGDAKRAKWLAEHPRIGTKAAEKLQQGTTPAAPAKQ